MISGKVVSWKADKGYGFVSPLEGDGEDVFLHVAEMAEGNPSSLLRRGVNVEYDEEVTDRGVKAVRVRFPLAERVEVRGVSGQLPDTLDRADECDLLTAEEYGRELVVILDYASSRIRELAKKHGWVDG